MPEPLCLSELYESIGLLPPAQEAASAWTSFFRNSGELAYRSAIEATNKALAARVPRLTLVGKIQDGDTWTSNVMVVEPKYDATNGGSHFPCDLIHGFGDVIWGKWLIVYLRRFKGALRLSRPVRSASFELLDVWKLRLPAFLEAISNRSVGALKQRADALRVNGELFSAVILRSISAHEERHSQIGSLANRALDIGSCPASIERTRWHALGDLDADTWQVGNRWDLDVAVVTFAYQWANLRHLGMDSDRVAAGMLLSAIERAVGAMGGHVDATIDEASLLSAFEDCQQLIQLAGQPKWEYQNLGSSSAFWTSDAQDLSSKWGCLDIEYPALELLL